MSHDTRGNFFGHYHRKNQLTNERGYKVVPLYVQDYVLICLLLQLESIYLQLRIKSLVL